MPYDQNNAEIHLSLDEARPLSDDLGSLDRHPNTPHHWYELKHDIFFIRYALMTIIMTISPWIFFGVVREIGGIEIHSSVVKMHQKATLYFVTAICSIIGVAAAQLFSKAVASLAQKRVAHKDMSISHGRLHLVIMVIVYLIVFALIVPGLAALLMPTQFIQTVGLHGNELNFMSSDPNCIKWFTENNNNYHACDWNSYKGVPYTTCLAANQLVDVLESGRGNILTQPSLGGTNLSNTSFTYIQLSAPGGLHFVGNIQGLLPNGPNGILEFNTLDKKSNSLFAQHPIYNYTLDLQGVLSNVTCAYENESPINHFPYDTQQFLYSYNMSCPLPPDGLPYLVSPNVPYPIIGSDNVLLSWACQTAENSYTVYLQGLASYAPGFGNIMCNITSIQPTVTPIKYMGQANIFTTQPPQSIPDSPNSTSATQILAFHMVKGVTTVIYESQNAVLNLVAESINTFAVKAFGVKPYIQDEIYLRLWEAMITGILDYEATYIRLLFSSQVNETTPPLCLRNVSGTADLEKFGWSRRTQNAAYLLPITLVNLTTLIILVIAMRTGTNLLPRFDPTDPQSLILSHDPSGVQLLTVTSQPSNPIPWRTLVAFGKNEDGIYRLWPKDQIVPA